MGSTSKKNYMAIGNSRAKRSYVEIKVFSTLVLTLSLS